MRAERVGERDAARISSAWPAYLDPLLARSRDGFVVAACVAVAVAFDLAIQSGLVGVGGALAIVVACAALALSGRLRNRTSIVLLAAAPLFALWLVFRASVWLIPLNISAACALVLLAVSLSSGGSLWDLSIPNVAARTAQAVVQAFLGPRFAFGGHHDRRGIAAIVRGVLVAVPVLLVLGVLLASADAVFASWFDFDIGDIVGHAVLIGVGALAMAWLLRLASVEYVDVPDVQGPKLGALEWTIVLGLLNAMLAVFAIARLVALSEGGRRVLASAGLTYAEYARSGFFQLLAAAIVTMIVVAVLRAMADRDDTPQRLRFTALSLGVVALTLALVVSGFHRLVLYERAFGLTMLRLYAHSAIVWVGIVLVLVGLWIAGVGGGRPWVWSAAGLAALVMLFAMNVLNPEAMVVRHNVAHQARLERYDPSYAGGLGDDAVPELARHEDLRGYVCRRSADGFTGWAAYNVAHDRAEDIVRRVCARAGSPQGG
jgi:hypothetical protein